MAQPQFDWYLRQWLEFYSKAQADLVNDLDWNKSKASLMWNGEQRYHRDDVNDVAAYLHLEPFELLLPPERAMAMRTWRAGAEQIVREVPSEPVNLLRAGDERDQATRRRTGRDRTTGTNG